MHNGQLIIRQSLTLADSFLKAQKRGYKYFGSLAKLINTWRDTCKAMLKVWAAWYGAVSARQTTLTMPARCLAGRWQSVTKAEKRLCDAGQQALCSVLAAVVARRGYEEEGPPPPGPPLQDVQGAAEAKYELDELRLEENKAFRQRMGRWALESQQVIADALFWHVTAICQRVHEPIDHLMNFLKHVHSPQEVEARGSHVSMLSSGKAVELGKEYEIMLDQTQWGMLIDSWSTETLETTRALTSFFLLQVLNQSSSFYRRITSPALAWPP